MPTTTGEDPRVTRSRAIILSAAHAHFVANGYVGANVDEIAAAAGVSKRTVYNIYGGKEALFRAVVDAAITIAERFSAEIAAGIGTDDLEGLAERLTGSVISERVIPLRRLLIGEARRFPELAREYYDRAPGLVVRTLAQHLTDHPGLRIDDPTTAAEHFAFLVLGAPLDRALFDDELRDPGARARVGVAAFRRAYGR
ncbi:TetR/AcrR family transcriptional regulator [Pseudonocardia pini]|uniref:TetR/AcrR family transcriptional regulator n=1 Tax=Pseudonocardia pini TaxID=2758030 RepID=UPI0015F0CB8F|nr:TetR/AcrR family transcriptional regulator [Pseudonocardia pini]